MTYVDDHFLGTKNPQVRLGQLSLKESQAQ
jgi:hypothetical protein